MYIIMAESEKKIQLHAETKSDPFQETLEE